ncbi:uncharacterized protein HD556DRAFT_1302309 [Suillus plorans]|uniref:Uncharacterized protein n=1 Tax=Suillus plorans TaxID=116603 RepID=A0A9P7E2Y9_9AGAM|nr:uncharacterized protein HD556DRAFT_1302309 [Suillus plorans]KAG1809891.1 hypothetical protein HD556DRAFT_1302309 [Suillus plorans]
MKYPKSSDISTNDWKQMQRAHWLKHCDQSENLKLWKEIREFWEGTSSNTDESSKVVYNRIMAERNAFALSCQAYSRLEDIYVGGFILYTGTEEAGRRAAGVFASSPLILDLINKKQADIKELADYFTTVIKYNHINDDASLPSFTCITAPKFNPELLCEKGEGTRDRNRHVAPIMMLEKFVIEGVSIPHEAENIPWKTMLNSPYLHQVQIVDWPAGVSPVGSEFIFKDLKTDELKALVGPYLKCCMGTQYHAELARVEHWELKKKRKDKLSGVKIPEKELMFMLWSDESKVLMANKDPAVLNVPLITDPDGNVQRTLMDCIQFMKNLPAHIEPPDSAECPFINLHCSKVSSCMVQTANICLERLALHLPYRNLARFKNSYLSESANEMRSDGEGAMVSRRIQDSAMYTIHLVYLVIIVHRRLCTHLVNMLILSPDLPSDTSLGISGRAEEEYDKDDEDGAYNTDFYTDY